HNVKECIFRKDPEAMTLYLVETKEVKDLNLDPLEDKQVKRIRSLLMEYKDTFIDELDSYPLPRINELLGALKQSAWYTTLDLA
ncbi:2539_t:CDS:2, partial [Racocetra fulgida]